MKVKFLLPAILMLICVTKLFAQPDMKETIDMIKKNLTNSKANMVNYEWLETPLLF